MRQQSTSCCAPCTSRIFHICAACMLSCQHCVMGCTLYLHQSPDVYCPGDFAGERLALFLHRKVLRGASLTGRVPPFWAHFWLELAFPWRCLLWHPLLLLHKENNMYSFHFKAFASTDLQRPDVFYKRAGVKNAKMVTVVCQESLSHYWHLVLKIDITVNTLSDSAKPVLVCILTWGVAGRGRSAMVLKSANSLANWKTTRTRTRVIRQLRRAGLLRQ